MILTGYFQLNRKSQNIWLFLFSKKSQNIWLFLFSKKQTPPMSSQVIVLLKIETNSSIMDIFFLPNNTFSSLPLFRFIQVCTQYVPSGSCIKRHMLAYKRLCCNFILLLLKNLLLLGLISQELCGLKLRSMLDGFRGKARMVISIIQIPTSIAFTFSLFQSILYLFHF